MFQTFCTCYYDALDSKGVGGTKKTTLYPLGPLNMPKPMSQSSRGGSAHGEKAASECRHYLDLGYLNMEYVPVSRPLNGENR